MSHILHFISSLRRETRQYCNIARTAGTWYRGGGGRGGKGKKCKTPDSPPILYIYSEGKILCGGRTFSQNRTSMAGILRITEEVKNCENKTSWKRKVEHKTGTRITLRRKKTECVTFPGKRKKGGNDNNKW